MVLRWMKFVKAYTAPQHAIYSRIQEIDLWQLRGGGFGHGFSLS